MTSLHFLYCVLNDIMINEQSHLDWISEFIYILDSFSYRRMYKNLRCKTIITVHLCCVYFFNLRLFHYCIAVDIANTWWV